MATHVDVSEVVFPGTEFRILTGTYLDADTDLPANTVAFDGDWPAGMVDMGYTKGGIIITLNRTLQEEYFDQDVDPVVVFTTQRDITIKTVLGQIKDFSKLAAAVGYGTVTPHAPSTGVHGYTDFDIAGGFPPLVDIVTAGELLMPDTFPMRFIAYRSQVRSSVVIEIMKDKTLNIPFEVRAMRDTDGSNNRVFKLRKIAAVG